MKKLNFLFIALMALTAGFFTSCDDTTTEVAPVVTFTSPAADSVEVTVGDSYTFKGTVAADVEAELTEIKFFQGDTELTDAAVTITDASSSYNFEVTVENIEADFAFKVVAYDSEDQMGEGTVDVVAKEVPMKEYSSISLSYTSTNTSDLNMFNAETGTALAASGTAADMDIAFVWQYTYGYSVVSPDSEWMKSLYDANSVAYSITDKNTTKIATSSMDFATATAADIQAMTVTTATVSGGGNGLQNLANGAVIAFETADGYKGLMKVNSSAKVTKTMSADFKVVAPAGEAK